jgi:hypothetical protein
MEVFKKTVSMVFSNDRRYVIPLFQRPYVWTRENQWEPLWDDIAARATIECELPAFQGPSQQEPPPHFLGAIVIQQRSSWGDELLAHDVIDGQQRLTTFQILLAAFRDVAASTDEKVASALTSWTMNANPITNPEVEQFKVWPTSRDGEQFRLVMMCGTRDAIERAHPPVIKRKRIQPRPRMVEAYLFFHEKVTGWLQLDGTPKISDRIKALRRVFDKRMQLVSIELEKQEDPQVIFETLNARGVPLLASDLLRNDIFQRAASLNADTLHKKYWARFEVADDPERPDGARFWEVEERQGRLNRARLDLFVQHYLSMKRGAEVLSGRLFPEYKAWIALARFPSIEDELRDFTRFAELFRELLRPTATTKTGRFAHRLRVLDNSTVYPLVLGLLGREGLGIATRDAIFVDLESFLVRRLVCNRPTKNYNRLFMQLLGAFQSKEPTQEAFRELLAAGTGENVDWPDDPTFERAWMEIEAYRDLKPARVEMVLRAIDEGLISSANESITVHGKLTVEHIIPQKWREHWPLPSEVDLDTATDAREAIIHAFGNLTLLTQPLNGSVSNGPASMKLPKIAAQSALRLNTYFQTRRTWTEEDIAERSGLLFRSAKRLWPGP